MLVVKYSGPFGFIKPWTAVRDSETFSQQFLTPSIVEGIEKKLFPEMLNEKGIHKIKRHRLTYKGISIQKEKTWSKGGFKAEKKGNNYKTNQSIIDRGVMIEPDLFLFFEDNNDAEIAFSQTICLCRNEDMLFPDKIDEIEKDEIDEIDGFELIFGENENSFQVGYNRFNSSSPMYGELRIFGNMIR